MTSMLRKGGSFTFRLSWTLNKSLYLNFFRALFQFCLRLKSLLRRVFSWNEASCKIDLSRDQEA